MNNTPDYKDNLYFEEKKMTDEYCASGDCERNAGVCKTLTEKWKKGELPSGYYYVKNEFGNIFPSDYSEDYDYIGDTVIKDFFTEVSEIKEVLEPVPSYDEWKEKLRALDAAHKAIKMEDETINRLVCSGKQLNYENAKLKELLKEWVQFEIEENPNDFTVMSERMSELANKTKEVLK